MKDLRFSAKIFMGRELSEYHQSTLSSFLIEEKKNRESKKIRRGGERKERGKKNESKKGNRKKGRRKRKKLLKEEKKEREREGVHYHMNFSQASQTQQTNLYPSTNKSTSRTFVSPG